MTLDTEPLFCFVSPLAVLSLRCGAGEALGKTCGQFNLSSGFLGWRARSSSEGWSHWVGPPDLGIFLDFR